MAYETQTNIEDMGKMTERASAFQVSGTNGLLTVGIYAGAGAPTFAASQGSLYLNTTGSSSSTRAYINSTGSTTWVAITTAS